MWIKKLNLRNVYTFGDSGTPELQKFNHLNLFIGKNGSGKSNAFRAICNIDVIKINSERYNNSKYYLGNLVRRRSYAPNFIGNQLDIETGADLLIEYEDEVVEFKNSYHIQGDFLINQGNHIFPNVSTDSLKNHLEILRQNNNWSATLSFSLTYIFERDFSIDSDNITEFFTKQGRSHEGTNGGPAFLEQWSSGFASTLNLLVDVLKCKEKVVCIEEPETHLEPRIIRRLIDILVWLSLRYIQHKNTDISIMEQKWDTWFENSTWKDDPDWKEIELTDKKPKQIFISSHSPVIINEFILRSEICSIYEFNCSYIDSSYMVEDGNVPRRVEQVSLISNVRLIEGHCHSILNNLGAQGADLLQSNGIIWVEGPSDIIYIKKWLEIFAYENNLT
ncbi:AAA family ATPase [uncultured Shewanella sp.]|uniref:ATP-dependent nuclease n=1 Tax=uncultured Shewanella sp. TaxID=173975 RepID=UPI00260C0EC3|nr:AAA family ATPase [uncultured Shewanella sp.]